MRSFTRRPCRESAFTLIEMMTVLLIVAVLSVFAYPSYREARLKSARAEGRSALLRLMQQQERFYTEHRRYRLASDENGDASDEQGDGNGFRWFSGASASGSAYRLEAGACESDEADCLLLRAVPANGLSDPVCDVLTLDSKGRQGASGPGACR